MSRRKNPERLSEFKVKEYFGLLTAEAEQLQQDILALSNDPTVLSLQRVILGLSICYPGGRSIEAKLRELDEVSKNLIRVIVSLNSIKKSAQKLNRKIVAPKTRDISKKLWYD